LHCLVMDVYKFKQINGKKSWGEEKKEKRKKKGGGGRKVWAADEFAYLSAVCRVSSREEKGRKQGRKGTPALSTFERRGKLSSLYQKRGRPSSYLSRARAERKGVGVRKKGSYRPHFPLTGGRGEGS